MSDPNKILITSAIPLPEMEEDDDRDLVSNAEIRADFLEVINSIGKGTECKNIILLVRDNIFSQNIKNLIIFCSEIFDKIEKVYDYVPSIKFDVVSISDVHDVINFLKYIEYEISFDINFILEKLKIDKKDILEFKMIEKKIKANFDNLTEEMAKIKINKLISDFLRTNDKERLVNLIMNRIRENFIWIYDDNYNEKGE